MTATQATRLEGLTAKRLGTVLWVNAGFSTLSALAFFFLADPLADWLGLDRSVLVVLAAAVGGFAVYVAIVATRDPVPAAHVAIVATADLLWVVAAAAIVVIPETLPVAGKVALAAVSLVVLDLGILEMMGYRRLSLSPTGSSA